MLHFCFLNSWILLVEEPLCELRRGIVGRDCRAAVLRAGYIAWRNVLQESVSRR